MNEEAKRLRIQLDINCGIRNITIVGLTSSVTKMSDLIAKKLRDMQNMHREMKEEKMVAKHIQWRYAGGQDGSWLNFGIRTNKVHFGSPKNQIQSTKFCLKLAYPSRICLLCRIKNKFTLVSYFCNICEHFNTKGHAENQDFCQSKQLF